ncbi:MAG: V-type ATP synthase subunit K [Treponema sp.]|nr:V-type ATP synthase subunit K [Treponema sp.]
MDVEVLKQIGIGASFYLSALGSGLAMGVSGPSVIGSWKKCYVQNRPAPFILAVFAGAALSNLIYGFIVMGSLQGSTLGGEAIFALGLGAGIAIGAVAVTQAMCAASAADAYAETGKGFGNFLMVIGIAETVALFAMVFTLLNA